MHRHGRTLGVTGFWNYRINNYIGRGILNDLRERLYVATFSANALEMISKHSVGMEINHTCISNMLDSEPDIRNRLISEIKRDIESSSAKRLVLHGPFTEIHPVAIDDKVRELGMLRLNQAYEICETLGVKKMVVHTGWLPFIYFKQYQAKQGAKFWRKFLEDKPTDFEIAIENVLEDEPDMLLDIVSEIGDKRAKLCLDIGHANAMTAGSPVEEWIRLLAPHISHFHLHNNDGSGDSHGAFDKGSMDMDRIFSLIEERCDKSVTMTVEARDAEPCLDWLARRGYI